MMEFEAALSEPGPLVAAWDYEDNAGTRLCLFSIRNGRATELAQRNVSHDTRDAVVDRLVKSKVRIGGMYAGTAFMWLADEERFMVWSDDEITANVTKADGAACVTLFVDSGDLGHRGVKLARDNGREELIAEEHDPIPGIDPTYGGTELFLDTRWAHHLGRHLASWLGVPFETSGPGSSRS